MKKEAKEKLDKLYPAKYLCDFLGVAPQDETYYEMINRHKELSMSEKKNLELKILNQGISAKGKFLWMNTIKWFFKSLFKI